MMTANLLTGGLILITGIALIIFLVAKLIPRTNHDHDTAVLLGIFLVIGIALVGMGGFIGMGGWSSAMMGHWGTVMGCWR
ncbi:hypothetical protein [Levilactobacillus wangkuiensis]|uniref:hypothetical protein n=1 Tax=Levilactobacillus wangkuiensis TaxID=2799566 RepID=UPI001942CFC4|nr:hypothetical protein [Levilactobacillus wangkuiensis]